MTPLRIALYQGPEGSGTPERNLGLLDEAARDAVSRGARLLVCPEMFLSGYIIGEETDRLAEPADGPSFRRAAEIAAEHGIALVYGYPERDGDAVYNAVNVLAADGSRLTGYRKTHLFGDYDNKHFAPGATALAQADIDGVRVGVLVCYDVEFPENVRKHALNGTELLVVPTGLMRPYEIVPRTIVPARAFENQLYLAYANRCGAEGDLEYTGLSCLVGPDGIERARAGCGEELIAADVDPQFLKASRAANTYLADRRPELY
ncbi:carbon-nitrogen hydrolase family protein [Wenjunlia tyrosinilytica]|jgi:predicted amidohydrolase|uniref:Hydrolase n=1 Tax=Wenjunlia tyrosinilytica TaxID=1544741 RepID=A0A917ZFW2_9ACTN|nr:carbon-nitrogen hydrolase family protein [Wenjunlia tyrosinilytica]GGO82240.1 hydrolase [Wenjunlia tyrosinilytica]